MKASSAAYTLTIPAKEIDARIDAEVKKVAPQVRMPGFRPGKVPANLIRKMHGEALHARRAQHRGARSVQHADAREEAAPGDAAGGRARRGLRARARTPSSRSSSKSLPDVPAPSIDGLKLERLTVEADRRGARRAAAAARRQPEELRATRRRAKKAADGDQVDHRFRRQGRRRRLRRRQGRGHAARARLGPADPGLRGPARRRQGRRREARSTSPSRPITVPRTSRARRPTFDVTVQARSRSPARPRSTTISPSRSASKDLDQLKGLLKGPARAGDCNGLTRTQMKRQLLDQLAADHDFEVPPSMVDAEFEQIWQQLEHEVEPRGRSRGRRCKEIEADAGRLSRIAERRVRLGLLLSEIGQANGVEVTQQEMNRLIGQAAQQYQPEGPRAVRPNTSSRSRWPPAQLRAPLYEDKVVDFLFSQGRGQRARGDPRRARGRPRERGRPCPWPGLRPRPWRTTKPAKKAAAKKPAAKKAEAAGEAKAEPKKAGRQEGRGRSRPRPKKPRRSQGCAKPSRRRQPRRLRPRSRPPKKKAANRHSP